MAEEGILYGDRVWFHDKRSRLRRLGVASHPEQGIVVLSLWTGDTCTGTFRLPTADAARLIGSLADGLVAAIPDVPTAFVAREPTGWRAWVASLRSRSRAKRAEVVPLRSVE
jgi:hypothetical protein